MLSADLRACNSGPVLKFKMTQLKQIPAALFVADDNAVLKRNPAPIQIIHNLSIVRHQNNSGAEIVDLF